MALPNKPKTVLELEKMTLWSKKTGAEKQSRLVWSFANNSPRITVFSGNPNERGLDGILNATMEPSSFFMWLEILEKTAQSTSEVKHKIDFYMSRKVGDSYEQQLSSSLLYGKNEDGVIWLSVHEGEKARIVFEMLPPDWNRFIKASGEVLTKAEASALYTLGFIKAARVVYGSLIAAITHSSVTPSVAADAADNSYAAKTPDTATGGFDFPY